jgi:CheY-like chemotaxis protein
MTSQQYSLLVVDDNEMNRDLLGRRLERQGYRVTMAVDGRQALEFINQEAFDLVLLDIMLPVMNGYEVLEHLKADQTLSHIPVIITTALDESDGKAKCMDLGAEDYLTKPFNPVLLKSRIGDCLERHNRA